MDRINARKRVMLTGTVLGTTFVIRICVVSLRTHLDRMQMCLDDIRAAVRELR
jgi:aromatic-L-amino-acid/L-tryptophan decarboxylase